MNADWIDVKDKLPEKTGWYLVFAPEYGHGTRENYDGMMFSKFIVARNGNKTWSVESTAWNKNVVQYWMNMPACPEYHDVKNNIVDDKQMVFEFEKETTGENNK